MKTTASLYARFRGSRSFLIALSVFIAFWVSWNLIQPWWPRFDAPGLDRLNLILSIEASLGLALLIMVNDRQEENQRKQLTYIQHMLEATIELLRSNRSGLVAEPITYTTQKSTCMGKSDRYD